MIKNLKELFRLKFKIKNILFWSFLIRFLLSFFLISFIDLPNYTEVGNYLNYNIFPYDHTSEMYPLNFYRKYPPLFFIIFGGWFFIFGNSAFSLRMLYLVCDMGSTYLIFKIGVLIKNREVGNLFAFIFSFIPFNLIGFAYGENDSIPTLFIMIALYFFFKNQEILCMFFLSLGILFKIYPIYIFFSFILYFFKIKEFKKIIYSISILIVMFLLTSLPFIFVTSEGFFNSIFVHFSRMNTGIEFGTYVLFFFENQYTFDIFNFTIDFSLNTLIQIVFIAVFSLFILMKIKIKEDNKKYPLIWSVVFILSQLIFMHKGNVSIFSWISPILIILLFIKSNLNYFKEINLFEIVLMTNIILIIALIIYNQYVPYNVFQNFRQMEGVVDYHLNVLNTERTIRKIDYVKLAVFLVWAICLYKKKTNFEYNILSYINLLNFLDWSMFYFIHNISLDPSYDFIYNIYPFVRYIIIFFLIRMIIRISRNNGQLRMISTNKFS